MKNIKGFTMVELMVVLVIVAILAAVATPIYLANVQRAKASEAVANMSLIRQALRDYHINAGKYFDIAADEIQEPLPPAADVNAATGESISGTPMGLNIPIGVSKYFSHRSFSVNAVNQDDNGGSDLFTAPPTVDFLITATGPDADDEDIGSVQCTDTIVTNCATNASEVTNIILEMDNTGRVYVSYDAGDSWTEY